MKKIKKIKFILVIIILMVVSVFMSTLWAKGHSLNSITEKFHQNNTIKSTGKDSLKEIKKISLLKNGKKVKNSKIKPQKPILVQTTQSKQMAIPVTVFSVGSLIAIKSANLSSEVDGRIVKIFNNNGDHVKKGMLIIQFDDAKAKADLYSAQAALNLSRSTYARYLALSKEGSVSQQDMDQKHSDLASKEAAVNTSLATLRQKSITAPFSGVLGVFKVTEGDYITAGLPLVSLVAKQKLRVEYTIPQKYIQYLKIGQAIRLHSESYPQKKFHGEVSYIAPSVDRASGSVTVQATIRNRKELLSPGMFVTVNQIIQENPTALVIPEQAIIAGLQGDSVFIQQGDQAHLVKIKLGERRNGFVQVLKGLELNDDIVIAGQQKLHDGSLIKNISNAPNNSNNLGDNPLDVLLISYIPSIDMEALHVSYHFLAKNTSWIMPIFADKFRDAGGRIQ